MAADRMVLLEVCAITDGRHNMPHRASYTTYNVVFL